MKQAIFNTKFASDMDRNNEIVKVIDYIGNDMYLIEFEDNTRLKVYDNELIFIGNESLYD